jgi:hypothetical protein
MTEVNKQKLHSAASGVEIGLEALRSRTRATDPVNGVTSINAPPTLRTLTFTFDNFLY